MIVKDLKEIGAIKARPDSTAATLDAVALDHLRLTPDRQLAKARFTMEVLANPLLVAQLFDRDTIRAAAEQWFIGLAKRNPAQAGGGGLSNGARNGHCTHAAPDKIDDVGLALCAHDGQGRVADVIDPLSAGGHMTIASNGQKGTASRAEPHDTPEGHIRGAGKAKPPLPSEGVTDRAGDGHQLSAEKAAISVPSPVRTSSRLRAAAEARSDAARTVFDSYRLRDGKAIGDVRLGDLRHIRAASAQDAALLLAIETHVGEAVNYAPGAVVRTMVGEHELQRYIQSAARASDAA